MIKAILFDFDGVLTVDKTGTQSICNYVCSKTNLTHKQFKSSYYKYNDKLLYGQIEHKDIWNDLCADIGIEIEYAILEKSFINTPIDREMMLLLKSLKKNYKIAMVTDNKKDRIYSIVQYHNWHSLFDVISVSAEIGSGKNNEIIFNQTLKKLNVNASECVFIDNSEENLVIPRAIGINTIFYNDEERDIKNLKSKLKLLEIII